MIGASPWERWRSPGPPEVRPELCLKMRHQKSTCQLCLAYCPGGSLKFNESLHLDSSLCCGCANCVNVCPTDVFASRGSSDETLLSRVGGVTTVNFTCAPVTPEENTVKVPCLGSLNEVVLVGAIAAGSQQIRLDITQCKQCQFVPGLRAAVRSLVRANQILALFGLPRKISAYVSPTARNYGRKGSRVYSRRELFSSFWGGMRRCVATQLERTESEWPTTMKTKVTLETRLPPKRLLLLEQLQKLGQPVAASVSTNNLPFAELKIDDGCDGCRMCVTFCPTGALRSFDEEGKQVIDFAPAYCLACRLCSDICPKGAIAYAADLNPGSLLLRNRKILVEHRKSVCPRCGQSYIAVGDSFCPECQRRDIRGWLPRVWQYSPIK